MGAKARNNHLYIENNYLNRQEVYSPVELFFFLWDLPLCMVINRVSC